MTPELLLSHLDAGTLWPAPAGVDLAAAYQQALAVRVLREQRGERPAGFKIGFTNRGIWDRYGVWAPIWGTVWDTTLSFCDGIGRLSLAGTCQPRLEPEAVFGLRVAPPAGASLQQLFDAIAWVAPGFEIVQSHCPDWKFAAADTVADGGLHARLLVGRRVPVRDIARDAAELEQRLAAATVSLHRDGRLLESGRGANVLDGPLHALQHFAAELQSCPGAPTLRAGDVVTTGTWTDAWPVAPGESWRADFSAPLSPLVLQFEPAPSA